MLPQEIIRKKRDGQELTAEEIAFIARGITDYSLSEGQVAAFAMAVFFRGMTTAERVAMTLGLVRSGSSSTGTTSICRGRSSTSIRAAASATR